MYAILLIDETQPLHDTNKFYFYFRWSQHLLWFSEHLRTHNHVFVLFPGGAWAANTAISVVEEISDHLANGPVHLSDDPCIPIAFHRLQLPERLRLVYRTTRNNVLFPLPQLLQRNVQEEDSEERVEQAKER